MFTLQRVKVKAAGLTALPLQEHLKANWFYKFILT